MMKKEFEVYIDSYRCKDLFLFAVRRPDIPAPERRVNNVTVPGRDGDLFETTEFFEDIEIEIEFNYLAETDKWHSVWRNAKKLFLNSTGKKISFSDDPGMFYKIKKVDVGINERTSKRIGKFYVSFVLDPYTYYQSGLKKTSADQCRYNYYAVSKPVFYITGEGVCTLNVNGNMMSANIGQNIVIDTERRISYRTDGTIQNTKVSGYYEKMYLIEGTNEISITEGFELQIQPNWRCI